MVLTSNDRNLVPPDGGWGWMILLSVVLCNIAVIPPMQFFGFVFKGISDELNLSMMQITIIITGNISFGLILNVILAPLIAQECVSRRKAAFVGAILVVLSYVGIGYSQNILHVILSFSICLALGVKLVYTATYESLKSYFVKVRRKAYKLALISIGIGGLTMAPLMGYLITTYKARLTMLILSGTSSIVFLIAILLQPVKYHLVEEVIDQEMQTFVSTNSAVDIKSNGLVENRVNGLLTSESKDTKESKSLLSSKNKYVIVPTQSKGKDLNIASIQLSQDNVAPTDISAQKTNDRGYRLYLKLLTSPIYVTVAVGIILNTIAESLFGALLPFMLYQFKFNAMDVGYGIMCFSSAMGLMKYIAIYARPKKPRMSARVICILSIVILIASRIGISLGFMNCFRNLLIAAIVIGSAKGFLLGYIEDTVSEILPPEEEEFAFNITNLLSGILLFIAGPIVASTKDITGSFQMVMLFINGMNSTVIIIWTAQLLISLCIEMYQMSKGNRKDSTMNNENTTT